MKAPLGYGNEAAYLLSLMAAPDIPTPPPAAEIAPPPAARAKAQSDFDAWRAKKKVEKGARTIIAWASIRRAILERDGHVCRICGSDPCESRLDVHHVDWDRSNNAHRNLVTLCQDCHRNIHAHGYRPDGQDVEPWGERAPRE